MYHCRQGASKKTPYTVVIAGDGSGHRLYAPGEVVMHALRQDQLLIDVWAVTREEAEEAAAYERERVAGRHRAARRGAGLRRVAS